MKIAKLSFGFSFVVNYIDYIIFTESESLLGVDEQPPAKLSAIALSSVAKC